MTSRKSNRNGRGAASAPLVTMEEVGQCFEGECVLMRVTDFDDDHVPARGHVLTHSRSRAQISKAFARQPRPSEEGSEAGRISYYIFVAYPRIEPVEAFRQVLARVAADPTLDVRVPW